MDRKQLKRIKKNIFRLLPASMRSKMIRKNMPPVRSKLDNIVFRCADNFDDYIKAFRLVHDVYVQAGYIQQQPSALRITPFHGNPLSRVFLGVKQEQGSACETIVYTISMFPDTGEQGLGLPMDSAFKQEMDCLRSQNRMLVEIGALASAPCHRQNNMNIPMLGNRIVQKYAFDYLKADDLVITVHPKYRWVYEDILLFEEIGYVDKYDYVSNNPAVAMRLNLNTAEKRYKKVYSNMPKEKNLHRFFFEKESPSIIMPKTTSISNKILVSIILNHAFSCQPPKNIHWNSEAKKIKNFKYQLKTGISSDRIGSVKDLTVIWQKQENNLDNIPAQALQA